MARARAHIFVACFVLLGFLLGGQTTLFNSLLNLRAAIDTRSATGEVVVVAIDAASIEKVGVWPWPRSLHGKLIAKLQKAGAQSVAFDIDFSSPSKPDEDASFEEALKSSSAVILPAFRQMVGAELRLTQPLSRFRDIAWTGLVNVRPDVDGIVRQYPFSEVRNGVQIPSMALMLTGGSTHGDSFYLDFGIKYGTIPVISYTDVLDENPETFAKLHGRKVIVGATALELGDRLTVPSGDNIPGPLLQALAAEGLQQNRALLRTGGAMSGFIAAIIALFMIRIWQTVPGWRRAVLIGVVMVASEGIAIYVQSQTALAWDTAPLQIVLCAYLLALTLDELDIRGLVGRISERRFRRITMSLGDALICTDRAGLITTCNPAAEVMFGRASAELVGQNIKDFIRKSALENFELKRTGSAIEDAEGVSARQIVFPAEVRVSSWDSESQRNYGIVIRDISDKKREAEKIRRLAEQDFLTGLANRYTLNRAVDEHIAQPEAKISLLLFDLDRFKELNDTHGHAFGDRVIKALADRLLTLIDPGDTVGRLGGDEFAILLRGPDCKPRSEALCVRILDDFSKNPVMVLGRTITLRATVGVAFYPDDALNTEALFSNADLALYRAKAAGRGQWLCFKKQFRDEFEQKLRLEEELTRAAEAGEFELFYQPQIDLGSGVIVGAEALIRWRHPTRGVVSPGEFLPVLNQSKLSDEVGRWVLRTACAQAAAWRTLGYELRIGVNLAPSQLQSPHLFLEVSSALSASGLPANLLEIEVTEDNVLSNEVQSDEVIRILREIGVRTAFDDFGTGFASLTHLKKFKLDVLKIDRSFIKDICLSADDLAIVRSIISLGKNFGMSIIAEGIEDEGAAEILRALGCDEAQGYHFGRPMPANEFLSFLKASLKKRASSAA